MVASGTRGAVPQCSPPDTSIQELTWRSISHQLPVLEGPRARARRREGGMGS